MKAQLQAFSLSQEQFDELPTWVISLDKSQGRRAAISKQLQDANSSFEIIAAVDGQQRLPREVVEVSLFAFRYSAT